MSALERWAEIVRRHRCDTPPLGLPGEDWRCPVCGLVWYAEEMERNEGVFIEWRRA